MSEPREVLLETEGDVAILTFNRPDRLNALNPSLLEAAREAVETIAAERSARALVLTGAGRAFSVGADLVASSQGFSGPREERDLGSLLDAYFHPFLIALRKAPFPIVSAVNGPAAGAGSSIALSADMIVADESAYFLQAFQGIGLVPDAGATYMLPRLVGRPRAMELAMLGERLPAKTALDWGMINRVAPDGEGLATAKALAARLAAGPTLALGRMRELFRLSETSTYEEQLAHEREAQRDAGRSEDAEEGVKAFIQKRPAIFKGR